MAEKRLLCDADAIDRAIRTMAEAISADLHPGSDTQFALVGMYKQGVPLAERLASEISRITGFLPPVGKLDISMYRDDVGLRSGLPLIRETVIPFNLENCRVLLVDDVLSTGRTIRAALDALTDYGRPAMIRLAVLVDRGDTEYPIYADYAGLRREVESDCKVVVELSENDPADAVWIVKKQA